MLLGFRNAAEHPFKELLSSIAHEYQRSASTSAIRRRKEDVLYRDYNHLGRMTIDRVRAILPSNNFRFYACGPGPMMESLVPALWDWGVPESHVHFEAFGPTTVKKVSRTQSDRCQRRLLPGAIRSQRAQRHVGRRVRFALEFGEALNIALVSGCRAGSCGECLIAVRSGNVTTHQAARNHRSARPLSDVH